jgi:hypothetical protein
MELMKKNLMTNELLKRRAEKLIADNVGAFREYDYDDLLTVVLAALASQGAESSKPELLRNN